MSMSAPSEPGESGANKGVIRVQGTFPDLQVKDRGGYQSRHPATLSILREVFLTYAPDFAGLSFDFFLCSFDNPESCNALADVVPHVLTYSVTDACRPNIIAVPDFIYGGWPEAGITDYTATAAAIAEAGQQPPQQDKVFWIGNPLMDESRLRLLEIGQEHPDLMEFIGMNWLPPTTGTDTRLPASHYVSLPDHAAYSMLLDIRGAGYSGRLKLLMQAGRPVFLVERPFREFFYDQLRPFEHYVPVRADLSDLVTRVAEVKASPELARKLGAGAAAFAAEYLTRAYALRYWRDVLVSIGKKA